MKNLKKYGLLLCLPLLLVGCGNEVVLQDGKQVVAEVEGKQVTAEELFDLLKDEYGTGAVMTLIDEYITSQELTEEMIETAEANALSEFQYYQSLYTTNWADFLANYGFKSDDEFMDVLLLSQKQNLTLEKYIKENVITEDEINEEYETNIYGEISARHILISPEVTDDMTDDEIKQAEQDALDKANNLIAELEGSSNLEEDFIALVADNSADTGTASNGGLLENFTNQSGLVDEFWEASLELEVGELSDAVETEFGYHIIYKVSQNEKPSLDTVRDSIISDLTDAVLTEENAVYVYWAALREKYNFQIHDSILDENYQFSLDTLE